MAGTKSSYIVQPVLKALKVLEHVAEQGHDSTLTEIATALKLPKTTAFRYLQTLAAASFLQHDSRRDRYGIGHRFRALATADTSIQRLRSLAQPEMAELHRLFNETVNLGIVAEGCVTYIDIIEANRALRMQARIGDRDPVHSTALGKAMAAFWPEEKREALLDGSLKEMTHRTITDRRVLRRQIDEVRRRGYALESGENEDGSMCIGVPILDGCGHALAALSLSAPERRMIPAVADAAISALLAASARLSGQFGAQLPAPAEDGRAVA